MNEEEWKKLFEDGLEEVADWIQARLIEKIERYDLEATGTLKKSVDVDTEADDDENAIISLSFEDYGFVLNKGLSGFVNKRSGTDFIVSRRPRERTFNVDGGRVGVSWRDIFDWTKARGIKFANTTQRGTASIITRSIRNRGIEKRPWLDDVLIKELPEIDRRIEKALNDSVQVGIDATLNDAFETGFGTATFR